MSPQAKGSQAPSPMLLILGGVVIVGALVYQFGFPTEQAVDTPVQKIDPISKVPFKQLKIDEVAIPARDPFMPSSLSLYLGGNNSGNRVMSPSKNVSKIVTGNMGSQPTWQGVMGTKDSRIAIIKFNGKNFLLDKGDRLPGTDYIVTEIDSGFVVLVSPKNRLRLEAKGR